MSADISPNGVAQMLEEIHKSKAGRSVRLSAQAMIRALALRVAELEAEVQALREPNRQDVLIQLLEGQLKEADGERVKLAACHLEERLNHIDTRARAEAAEAQVAKLMDDAAFIQEQRASAMLRRNLNAPEDAHVQTLCERYGYGAVMDAASRLWAREDSMGAFYIGGCIGMKTDADARAALSAVKLEGGE